MTSPVILHAVASLSLVAYALGQWTALHQALRAVWLWPTPTPHRPCCAPGCHLRESRGHLCSAHLRAWTEGYGKPRTGWWVLVGGLTCVREESGVDGRPLRELVRDAGEWWAPTRRLTPPTGVAPRG